MFASTFCITVDIKRDFFCVFLLLSVPFVHLKGEWCTWSTLSASGLCWNEKWKDGERRTGLLGACCWRRFKLPRENRMSSITGSTLEPLAKPTVPNRLISSVCFPFLFTVVAGSWVRVAWSCPKCSRILNKTGIVLGNAQPRGIHRHSNIIRDLGFDTFPRAAGTRSAIDVVYLNDRRSHKRQRWPPRRP